MSHASRREIWVGLVVVASLMGLAGLLVVASGGSGSLAAKRTIDVLFRDGQGLRVGNPVRVAGIEVGRVVAIDLAEVDGSLRARVRLSLPADLAGRLRQDVKVAIQPSLTGQSCINVVSSGRSTVALVPGQLVQGIETTFFDPILEQVGLGPVERSHLSHTIAEVRQTVDAVSPRLRQILGSLQETVAGFRETADTIRPTVEASAGHIEDLTRRLDLIGPKLETILARLDALTKSAEGTLAENRPNLQATLASLRDLTATLHDMATKDRVKLDRLLDGMDAVRVRTERTLFNAEVLTGQGAQLLTRNRAALERAVANVRDATDWANQLVQKVYANPIVLSPLYKPRPEDLRTQAVADTARLFIKGAQELSDLVKTLEGLQARPMNPQQKQEFDELYKRAWALMEMLSQTEKSLAEGLRPQARR